MLKQPLWILLKIYSFCKILFYVTMNVLNQVKCKNSFYFTSLVLSTFDELGTNIILYPY